VEPLPPVTTATAWASPGTTADAPRFRSAPTIFDAPAPPSKALLASPVSRLQPRTVGQLLDGGFEVLRFRVRTIALVAAAIVLPLYAVPQMLVGLRSASGLDGLGISGSTFGDAAGALPSDYWTQLGWTFLAAIGLMFATMLTGVAVAHLVGSWLHGIDPTPGDTLRFVRSRLPVAAGAFALVLLLKVLVGGLTCSLALVYLVPVLSVLAPVVAAESLGVIDSIRRTYRLTRRRFWTLLGVSVLWAVTSWLISLGASAAAAVVGGLVGAERGAAIALQAVNVVATVVLLAVQVSVTALVYIDLRVRTEGFDLELEATERFHVPLR